MYLKVFNDEHLCRKIPLLEISKIQDVEGLVGVGVEGVEALLELDAVELGEVVEQNLEHDPEQMDFFDLVLRMPFEQISLIMLERDN
jgi:hypothetical protein